MSKNGKIWLATCINSQATTPYETATLLNVRPLVRQKSCDRSLTSVSLKHLCVELLTPTP